MNYDARLDTRDANSGIRVWIDISPRPRTHIRVRARVRLDADDRVR
jgi:hypothetical protein